MMSSAGAGQCQELEGGQAALAPQRPALGQHGHAGFLQAAGRLPGQQEMRAGFLMVTTV